MITKNESSDLVFYRQKFIDFAKSQGLMIDPPDVYWSVADYYAKWVRNSVDGKPMEARGLFIFGNTGSGKTTLVRTLQHSFGVYPSRRRGISYRTIGSLVEKHTYDPYWVYSEEMFYAKKDYILDDFGKVTGFNCYGNRFDVEPLIESRYQSYREYGSTTIFTSNLTSFDELVKQFSSEDPHKGERIKSRLCEMCDFIVFNYKDRRQSSIRILNNSFRNAGKNMVS